MTVKFVIIGAKNTRKLISYQSVIELFTAIDHLLMYTIEGNKLVVTKSVTTRQLAQQTPTVM